MLKGKNLIISRDGYTIGASKKLLCRGVSVHDRCQWSDIRTMGRQCCRPKKAGA